MGGRRGLLFLRGRHGQMVVVNSLRNAGDACVCVCVKGWTQQLVAAKEDLFPHRREGNGVPGNVWNAVIQTLDSTVLLLLLPLQVAV